MQTRDDQQHQLSVEGANARQAVRRLLESDISQAYKTAQAIRHPWYRCQALAIVAEKIPKNSKQKLLLESLASAKECHDENRRVSVACWPLNVAISDEIRPVTNEILTFVSEQLSYDTDPISMWCAVSVLWTIRNNDDLLDRFFPVFKKATSKGHGWRVERDIKNLLSDPAIQKEVRYVNYLMARQLGISRWKTEYLKK